MVNILQSLLYNDQFQEALPADLAPLPSVPSLELASVVQDSPTSLVTPSSPTPATSWSRNRSRSSSATAASLLVPRWQVEESGCSTRYAPTPDFDSSPASAPAPVSTYDPYTVPPYAPAPAPAQPAHHTHPATAPAPAPCPYNFHDTAPTHADAASSSCPATAPMLIFMIMLLLLNMKYFFFCLT